MNQFQMITLSKLLQKYMALEKLREQPRFDPKAIEDTPEPWKGELCALTQALNDDLLELYELEKKADTVRTTLKRLDEIEKGLGYEKQ